MFLIVGAGITGITLAERLAADGKQVVIIDRRDHIGGNCFDYRNQDGILIHKYGPHIFHESDERIVAYLSRFTDWVEYRHKVVAYHRGEYFPIPINRTTINRFFHVELDTEESVREFLKRKRVHTPEITNSRDVVVSRFGEEIYETFIKHYTKKQWDLYPEELDKSILERLPVRYDDNPYYFNDSFQGLPKNGYTKMLEMMLDNPNIRVELETDFTSIKNPGSFRAIVYTGRIDQYFGSKYGTLEYRCIDFVFERTVDGRHQPYAVVNYPGPDVAYTRKTEFKHFYDGDSEWYSTPRYDTEKATVICKEFPSWEGEPSYPVINPGNLDLFRRYVELSELEGNVFFAGRSGTFRYLNMNQAVSESLKLFDMIR